VNPHHHSIEGGFESTLDVGVDLRVAWERLVARPAGEHLWLAGFDAPVEVFSQAPPSPDGEGHAELVCRKTEDPCGGTRIVVRLDDHASEAHSRLVVSQTEFQFPFEPMREILDVGWRHIVADLQTFLATGVHTGRHNRPWVDIGADGRAVDGGVMLSGVVPGGLAEGLGLRDGDLVVAVCNTPVSSLRDLVAVLRTARHLDAFAGTQVRSTAFEFEWIRDGALHHNPAG
jgi:hypothetical protein